MKTGGRLKIKSHLRAKAEDEVAGKVRYLAGVLEGEVPLEHVTAGFPLRPVEVVPEGRV